MERATATRALSLPRRLMMRRYRSPRKVWVLAAPARSSPPRSWNPPVNQVISKRMVKKQQMRWSPRGAHLLLQIRTRVLNDTLAEDYRRWYPHFTHKTDQEHLAA